MEMGKLAIIFGVVAISLIALGCVDNRVQFSGGGNAVFAVADAAPNMSAISGINITVNRVQVQNSTQDWIVVSSVPRNYDLLQLKASGARALLVDANLSSGRYGQVKLEISGVVVTDSYGDHEAKLPSGDLKIVDGFEVLENSTTAVTFDFRADQSLHVTGNGLYILAPVVYVQERQRAQVDTRDPANVKINGGRAGTDFEVGMDENGNVGVGNRIPASANLSIGDDGRVRVGNAFGYGRP